MLLSLKVAILTANTTQRAVSLQAQIPETRLSAIIRGHAEALPAERTRLAAVLNVPEEKLFASEHLPEGCTA